MQKTEKITVWSWRHAVLKSGLPAPTRHLLLTLSCYMNDLGDGCYPTVETLVENTGLSKRSIITHIAMAVDAGWLEKRLHGFKGSEWRNNEYRACFPDDYALQNRGAGDAPQPEKRGAAGAHGGAGDAPNVVQEVHPILPVDTSNNPNKKNNTKKSGVKKANEKNFIFPDWLDGDAWNDFARHRQAMRAPLNGKSIELNIRTLEKLRAQGHDPTAVIHQSIERGWKGLFAIKGEFYGNGQSQGTQGNLRHAGQAKPSWKSESQRLLAKYEAEEQAAIAADAGENLRLAEAIRQDSRGAGDAG